MFDQRAVKNFSLETIKKNATGVEALNVCFPASHTIIHDNGRLFYANIQSKVEEANVVNVIGHLLIRGKESLLGDYGGYKTQTLALWGMNYDGWYEGGEEIYALGNELLIKALLDDESFGSRKINGTTEDKRLLYEIEINGRFQLFEIKIIIMLNDRRRSPISKFTYRGRALVSF